MTDLQKPPFIQGEPTHRSGVTSHREPSVPDGHAQKKPWRQKHTAEVTGQLAEVRGQLADVTDRLAEATGQLAEVTGQLAEVTGHLTEVTGQLA